MHLTKTTFFVGCLVGGLGAALAPLLFNSLHAETRLLPFQGRLTDPNGAPLADGAKVVQFQIYDAPTGGTVKWIGEVQKLTVNGGLVNTLLGSKASLGGVDFSTPTYLQTTVDADGDNQITLADPPLLPRQSIVPSIYASESGQARNSTKLVGADWSAIMIDGGGNSLNDPVSGFIKGTKIQPNGISASHLAPGSVTATQIGTSAVASSQILDGTIQLADLALSLQNTLTPPGTVVAYIGDTAPIGWLLCDGSELDRIGSYAVLAAVAGARFGVSSDPVNKFKLPDFRGYFLRGADGAAGRDPDKQSRMAPALGGGTGGMIGSVQEDAFQGHHHLNKYSKTYHQWGDRGGGWQSNFTVGQSDGVSSQAFIIDPVSDGVNGAVRSGAETRPKNIYINYIIKY